MNLHRVVIIGMGNIGRRHLQGVSFSKAFPELDVVIYDINTDALESLSGFLEENKMQVRPQVCSDFSRLLDTIDQKTAVIIATTADARKQVMEKVLEKNPMAIIAEKPAAQSMSDYEHMVGMSKNVPVYVNLTRHSFPLYKKIYQEIGEQVTANIHFSNIGFACNGIHLLDLVCWLLRAEEYTLLDSGITSTYESKRRGFQDFSGYVHLKLGNNTAFVRFMPYTTLDSVEIISPSRSYKIFEMANKALSFDGKEIQEEVFRLLFVSEVTAKVVDDLFLGKTPGLPTLSQAKIAHEILFEIIKKHKLDIQIT